MKKLLTILFILISFYGYCQNTVNVRTGSGATVYTTSGATSMFVNKNSFNTLSATVTKNSTDISSLLSQNAALTQQIATMQSNITALTKTTITQQKQIDSLLKIKITVIKPLYTNAIGDSLWYKP